MAKGLTHLCIFTLASCQFAGDGSTTTKNSRLEDSEFEGDNRLVVLAKDLPTDPTKLCGGKTTWAIDRLVRETKAGLEAGGFKVEVLSNTDSPDARFAELDGKNYEAYLVFGSNGPATSVCGVEVPDPEPGDDFFWVKDLRSQIYQKPFTTTLRLGEEKRAELADSNQLVSDTLALTERVTGINANGSSTDTDLCAKPEASVALHPAAQDDCEGMFKTYHTADSLSIDAVTPIVLETFGKAIETQNQDSSALTPDTPEIPEVEPGDEQLPELIEDVTTEVDPPDTQDLVPDPPTPREDKDPTDLEVPVEIPEDTNDSPVDNSDLTNPSDTDDQPEPRQPILRSGQPTSTDNGSQPVGRTTTTTEGGETDSGGGEGEGGSGGCSVASPSSIPSLALFVLFGLMPFATFRARRRKELSPVSGTRGANCPGGD